MQRRRRGGSPRAGVSGPLSTKRHVGWGLVRKGPLPKGSTLEQRPSGTRGRGGACAGDGAGPGGEGERAVGASGGRGCGQGSGEDPGAAPTWPVGSGRSPSVRPHSLRALPAPSPSPEAGPAGLSGCVRLGWPGAAGGRRLHQDPRRGGAVPARPHPAARPPGTWALRPPGPAPVRSSLSAGAPGTLLQVPRGRRSADDLGPRPPACGGCGGPGWGMGDAGGQN